MADTLFLNWAVGNNGTDTADTNWNTQVLLNGIGITNKLCQVAIPPKAAVWTNVNVLLGRLPKGTYTAQITLNSDGSLFETTTNNNTYTKTFVVSVGPADVDFSPLSGWSSPVVISATPDATNTQATNFTSTDKLYVSLSVTNKGFGPTADSWLATIYIDGVSNRSYQFTSSMVPSEGLEVRGFLLERLPVGLHQINVVLDSSHQCNETNRANNTNSTTLLITPPNATAVNLSSGTQSPWLNWTTSSDAPWSADTASIYTTTQSIRSAIISGDVSSWVQTVVSGPGILTYCTRSQATNTQLTFSINDVQKSVQNGALGWTTNRLEIPAGQWTLRWTCSSAQSNAATCAAWLRTSFVSTPGVTPIITNQPISQSTGIGGTALFTVDVSSGSKLTYQWRKNGTKILKGTHASGYNTPVLLITNAAAIDAASYSVFITSAYGSTTSALATLTVTNLPPVITSQTTNAIRSVGDRALLQVSASGTAPLAYRWIKGNTVLSGETIASANSYVLNLTNLNTNATGVYWVIVSNAWGTATSAPMTLVVQPADSSTAPILITQPQNTTVAPGRPALFSVNATGSNLTYQWYFKKTKLSDNARIFGSKTATLTLTNAQTADAGTYTVIISNPRGSTTSSNAILTVSGQPPSITTPSATVTRTAGDDLVLTATATGTGPLNFTWLKNGAKLPAKSVILNSSNTSSLVLTNLQLTNAAIYTVIASNIWGTSTGVIATLTVKTNLPFLISNPRSLTNKVGTTATFSVTSSGSGPAAYQWYWNAFPLVSSNKIAGATTSKLVISNVYFTDVGAYTVVVSNSVGITISAPASLTVLPEKVAPKIILGYPTATATVLRTNPTILTYGAASDNFGISNIQVRLNTGSWADANGATNWNAFITMVKGTNTLYAKVTDLCGNTNTVTAKFTYVPAASLTVETNGLGAASYTNNQLVALGQTNTIKATPGSGYRFTKWTTNLVGGTPVQAGTTTSLKFVMTTNLVIKAWFDKKATTPDTATYQGLFFTDETQADVQMGYLTATFQDSGAFSASLKQRNSTNISFSGQWTDNGWSTNSLAGTGLALSLRVDTNDTGTIIGTVKGANWSADLQAVRIQANPKAAGTYYVTIAPKVGSNDPMPLWVVQSYVTIKSNNVVILNWWFDQKVVVGTFAGNSDDGLWPFYDPTTGATGWLQLPVDSENTSESDSTDKTIGVLY